jgi:4-alpha-glucanotransferase
MLIGLEPLVREGLLHDEELDDLAALPASEVNFQMLNPIKKQLLVRAAERFVSGARGEVLERFEAFCETHDDSWLHDYAVFRVLKTKHEEQAWSRWAPELAQRDKSALSAVERSEAAPITRVKVLQYFFDRQWRALRSHAAAQGLRLFGDLPFYVALDSADAWSGKASLLVDQEGRPSHVAGVPPDYFSKDGQLWGNPLYDWGRHAEEGYQWWISRLREAAAHFDLVRVDHFRGFESYWSVPFGNTTARKGEWKPGPADAFFKAASAALGELPLVAEDLGIITEEVIHLRRRHRIPGMRVLQFELADPGFDPAQIPEDCACYTATHDNETTVGWFHGQGGSTRTRRQIRETRRAALRHSGGTSSTIHLDLIRLAFGTRARVALAPMQDFLGLGPEARLNVPGTSSGNWRWRLTSGQLTDQNKSEIATLVQAAGRG